MSETESSEPKPEPSESRPMAPEPKAKEPRLAWAVAAGCGVLALLVWLLMVLPQKERAELLEKDVARLKGELEATKVSADGLTQQIDTLLKDKDSLSQEATVTKVRLDQALEEKAEALAALEKAKEDLSKTLGTQIAAGDVLIKEVKGELVVDVADKLLFDSGQATLNEEGEKLLDEVAKSMRRLSPHQIFQVGGHTDSQRVVSKELVEQYPTNWELAAARATKVVRHLQDKGRVPGRQLVAASFSQYRPASSNKTEQGRQKNRRIEIVLLRRKP